MSRCVERGAADACKEREREKRERERERERDRERYISIALALYGTGNPLHFTDFNLIYADKLV